MKIDFRPNGHPILCMNSGSSSLKFALYQLGDEEETLLAEGAVERIGLQDGHLWIRGARKEPLADVHSDFPEHKAAVQATFTALNELSLPQPAAVGHRLVHGGPDHASPVRVDPRLLDTLRGLAAFAPLHLPSEIQGIEAVGPTFPNFRRLPASTPPSTGVCRSWPSASRCPASSGTKGSDGMVFMASPMNTF